MSHRLGTCTSCKAQYKVPASFQADRAKCKSCGGVVQIAPAGGSAAPAKPAAPATTAAAARPVPARPVASAPRPAPQPAQKPAPKPVVEEKPAVRSAAAGAAERVRAGAAASAHAARSSSGSRSGAKEITSKRGARGGKEPNKAPMLAAVLLLLVAGGGGAWFFLRGGDAGPKAAESSGEVAAAPTATEASAPAAVQSAPEATKAPAEATRAAEAPTSDAPPAAEAPAARSADEDIDLSVFPDEGKLPGTSDEDWAAIQEWTASFLDANAGAAGNRARGKLFERGRESFPAMLNAMKRLDFSSDDGFRAGDLAQRFLMDVCNGQNFGWKYGTQPADVLFNKKVVRSWIKAWEQGRDVAKGWAKLTKTTEEEAAKLFALTGPFDGAAPAPAEAGASSSIDDL